MQVYNIWTSALGVFKKIDIWNKPIKEGLALKVKPK
jgi:hypothetical protein